MQPSFWPAAAAIYSAGIATGVATFQTEAPSWEDWDAAHLPVCRLAAEEGGTLLGWAALSPTSARAVYRGVAEVSIYVDAAARGRGIGTALLRELILASEKAGLWTLQAVIQRENKASLRLHQACGFRLVGYRERIAQDARGVWRDTWLLERRKTQE